MDRNPPPRRRPNDLAGYLEALSRPVFQAGLSSRVIDGKWEAIREAFARFDPVAVADFDQADVERLLVDRGVVRSESKIEGTIDNAQALLELDAEYGGFARYLRSHADFEQAVADLKRQFRFIGDSGAYQFLYTVAHPVPPHDEWFAHGRRQRPRREQTPAAADKSAGASRTRAP